MPTPDQFPSLSPEQEKQAKEIFARRKFGVDSYERDMAGPEIAPAMQVAIAAGELAEIDNPTQPTSQAQDELARLQLESEQRLELDKFRFLDPKDYEDVEARTGRVLKPGHLLDLLRACGLQCWFSLADAAVVAKELNPRDVALAKLKIGENPENLLDMRRWRDAIAEVKQEEAGRQRLRDYELLGLQICRKPDVPEYCCWVPGCDLREFDVATFDSHKIPKDIVRGWRTVLIEVVRKRFATEETVHHVFGVPEGKVATRYLMIMQGLRAVDLEEDDCAVDVGPAAIALSDEEPEEPVARCPDCHHRGGHFSFCVHFEAWLNASEEQNGIVSCLENLKNECKFNG
jgi:hypothetical protein